MTTHEAIKVVVHEFHVAHDDTLRMEPKPKASNDFPAALSILILAAEENEGRKLASLWKRTGRCKIWEKDIACPLYKSCSKNHSGLQCLDSEKHLTMWVEAAKKEEA